jgi:hypothetical protein
MRRMLVALLLVLATATPVGAQPTGTALEVSVDPGGRYTVHLPGPDWSFGGDVGHPLSNIRATDGQDGVGAFHELDFDYQAGVARTAGVRVYRDRPVVLFTTTYLAAGPNAEPFPVLHTLPNLPYKLSYRDTPFSPFQLNSVAEASDSPWLFFNTSGNGFLISPAQNFPVARMSLSSNGTLASGIDAGIASLPAGYSHQTLLVAGTGPNRLFDAWGAAMTALHGKTRPANDADLTLEKLGYWTDNGATYYYHFEPQLGYAGTLVAVKHEFDQRGIALGYLQLDSWWYPKGFNARWDDKADGIFRYRAAPELFPDGLPAFQQQVGLPLVTHARWIDPSSPYRGEFSQGFSGNVMTDARYWTDLMSYLQTGGVVTYEQDWLGAQAQPVYDLSAPQQFMGNMASAAAQRGMTLQYCMPLPRHVLQTVEYGNVTTMRVSDDRFDRNRWDTFLYTSRLASALGVWPWADVFMSTETDNVLIATLSAGMVGNGDKIGAENKENLLRAVRMDGVIVKPDAPLVPIDAMYTSDAVATLPADRSRSPPPMIASAHTDHGALRTAYVFAYSRGSGNAKAAFTPAQAGIEHDVYLYDARARTARRMAASETFTFELAPNGTAYFVLAPVSSAGVALFGDDGKFVPDGRKRLAAIAEVKGRLMVTVTFAPREKAVRLFGYATRRPAITAQTGSAGEVAFDKKTGRFEVTVSPSSEQVNEPPGNDPVQHAIVSINGG